MHGSLKTSTGKTQQIPLQFHELSQQEKQSEALKILGKLWLGAIVSLPLPPIHWVLTPGFFIAGIVWYFKKLNLHNFLLPLNFNCLECQKTVDVIKQPAISPLSITCPHCKHIHTLSW